MNIQSAKLIWRDLKVAPAELRLDTLRCGQSFRWRENNGHWACVLQGQIYVLKETDHTILYGVADTSLEKQADKTLRDYFQLDRVKLAQLYERWSKSDANFKRRSERFQGIRILRQDPCENVVSFICSSNNNIARITQMVQKLCFHYGAKVGTVDGVDHYDFPTWQDLAKESIESELRELGFGYRAKYIAQTARLLAGRDPTYLVGLRDRSYMETKTALLELPGVGPKVADCVCLMSMDHTEAIPVDTHVWQIALRDYGFRHKAKTLNDKVYQQVGAHFRELFGAYSGWAHSVLFTADLRQFAAKTEATSRKRPRVASLKKEASPTAYKANVSTRVSQRIKKQSD